MSVCSFENSPSQYIIYIKFSFQKRIEALIFIVLCSTNELIEILCPAFTELQTTF